MEYYKLDGNNEVVQCSIYEHIAFMANNSYRCRVGFTSINGIEISTAFIGINCSLFSEKPLVFETLIFYPKTSKISGRYASWSDAIEGHKKTCKQILEAEDEENLEDIGLMAALKALTSDED